MATFRSLSITGSFRRSRPSEADVPTRSEKGHVLRARSQRHVLAVVGRRVGVSVAHGQRLYCAAERGARLEQRDGRSSIDELEGSGEPGEAASDDHTTQLTHTTDSLSRLEINPVRARAYSGDVPVPTPITYPPPPNAVPPPSEG